ncbi:MAG: hypothetical protein IPN67_06660 [Bacteroidales bacterium]|nr:hypothetical protein [Bacteroidales bacterium]MBK8882068.1 hypothetical protein [Bacteroidales bacterium]
MKNNIRDPVIIIPVSRRFSAIILKQIRGDIVKDKMISPDMINRRPAKWKGVSY